MVCRAAPLLAASFALAAAAQNPPVPRWWVEPTPPARLTFADGTHLDGTSAGATWRDGSLALGPGLGHVTFPADPRLAVDARRSFTLELELRTESSRFATPLMCRLGGGVHYSIVLGREPGRASGELWSWARERAIAPRRVDDGQWHALQLVYDAEAGMLALAIDGSFEVSTPIRAAFTDTAAPALRLGDNLDPNVRQQFDGELRNVRLSDGVPETWRARREQRARLRVLDPAAVEAALFAWNDRHRAPRAPVAEDGDRQRSAAILRARVQDALGLWPPPGDTGAAARLLGRPTPLTGGDGAATDFATYRSALPLEIVEGGSLERDGYRLTHVRWSSLPGWFASGWLYRPTTPVPTGRRAAVLCPHGHWADGARHPVVQSRCIALARLGYVVLAVDSIHVHDDRVALSPVGAMTWNNLRGLQLLRSLPEVDPARIGCTGASGGGQQTYYLTALRTGLAAAVPAVMAAHFREILYPDQVHCSCNHVPWLVRAADMPQMAAAFAPAPQLFLCVTGDWTREFPRHGFPGVHAVYAALGAPDRCRVHQWEKGHDYDRPMREAMYGFFERWLRGAPTDADLPEPDDIAPEPLHVLTALERRDVPGSPAAIAAEFRARLECPPIGPDDVAGEGRAALLETVLGRFRALLGRQGRGPATVRAAGGDPEHGLHFLVAADPSVELPVTLLRPTGPARGIVVCVAGGGRAAWCIDRRSWLDVALAAGRYVVCVDVRYTGDLDAGSGWRELHGRFFGEDEGRLAVGDLQQVLDALPALLGESLPVTVVAAGWTGAVALLTAAIDRRIDALFAAELGAGWREVERRPRLARVLLHGDLPDAACLVSDRRVALGGCPDPERFAAARVVCGDRLTVESRELDVAAWTAFLRGGK